MDHSTPANPSSIGFESIYQLTSSTFHYKCLLCPKQSARPITQSRVHFQSAMHQRNLTNLIANRKREEAMEAQLKAQKAQEEIENLRFEIEEWSEEEVQDNAHLETGSEVDWMPEGEENWLFYEQDYDGDDYMMLEDGINGAYGERNDTPIPQFEDDQDSDQGGDIMLNQRACGCFLNCWTGLIRTLF
jgi:hypothetical protein